MDKPFQTLYAYSNKMQIPDAIQRAFDSCLASIETDEALNEGKAEDYQEVHLSRLLAPFIEAEKLAFIEAELLRKNPVSAMILAELCLENKESFRAIIEGGFPYINSAQIRYWLTQSLRYVDKAELLTYINDLSSNPSMKRMALFYYKGLTKVQPAEKQA